MPKITKLYLVTTKTKARMKATEETIHSISRAEFRELSEEEIRKIIKIPLNKSPHHKQRLLGETVNYWVIRLPDRMKIAKAIVRGGK